MIAQTNKRLGVSMGKAEVPCHKTLLRNYIDWKKQSTLKRSFVWEGFFMIKVIPMGGKVIHGKFVFLLSVLFN